MKFELVNSSFTVGRNKNYLVNTASKVVATLPSITDVMPGESSYFVVTGGGSLELALPNQVVVNNSCGVVSTGTNWVVYGLPERIVVESKKTYKPAAAEE